MRKRTIPVLIATAAAVLASLPMLLGVAGAATKTTVTVGNNFFKPGQKTIAKGTKVRFNWVGGRRHNVTKVSGPGAAIESRTTSAAGVNFVKQFEKRGTYRFICTVHPTEMKLKLIVD